MAQVPAWILALLGVSSQDAFYGTSGPNTIDGNFSNDYIEGGDGGDKLGGNAIQDLLEDLLGRRDTLGYWNSDAGVTVNFSGSSPVVSGGDADGDTLTGFENMAGSFFDDTLIGSAGDNILVGGAGNDTMNGGDGDDIFVGGAGTNTITGGDGDDTVIFDSSIFDGIAPGQTGDGGTIDLGGGNNTIKLFSNSGEGFTMIVSAYDASITAFGKTSEIVQVVITRLIDGSEGDDILYGSGSIYTMNGFGGSDLLQGDTAHDRLYGGAGVDSLLGRQGNDLLDGGEGADHLFGGADDDTLSGGADSDTLQGDDGSDLLDGGEGADYLFGGADDDTLYGGADSDTLQGDDGSDLLDGGGGNDELTGNAGSDTIVGGNGNDQITGGERADTLTGGSGADIFVYLESNEILDNDTDTITDFAQGDRINVSQVAAFTFIGSAAFTHKAGQLRYGNGFIQGDVNGDGFADLQISSTSGHTFTASDFIL